MTPPQDIRDSSSPRPLRVAIIGAGLMGRHHARAVRLAAPLAELVAFADPSAPARSTAASEFPGVQSFASPSEMLATVRPDLVHICTSPATHGVLAREALEAGCHIYVEKPFVESVADAEPVLALARARGRAVCAGHQLLVERPMLEAMRLLPSLGSIAHIESYFSFKPSRRGADGRLANRADLQLLDILPHPVYLLLHALRRAEPAGTSTLAAVEIGRTGTVHALVRRNGITGVLVVTLDGRPVDSYLRLSGENGSVHADFVRGTVQRMIGPGISGIDKVLNPFRISAQLAVGTVSALVRRATQRRRSYPGLVELFSSFYKAIQQGTESPVTPADLLETVAMCECIARALPADEPHAGPSPDGGPITGRSVLVTGATGFLGREVVAALRLRAARVRAVARRAPAPWDRAPDVEYVVCDVGAGVPPELLEGVETIIHCAAETAGGWDAHQRNSIDATEQLVRAASDAGVMEFIHVSSLAVLADTGSLALDENTPVETEPKRCGPYVWGKTLSENSAVRLGKEIGVRVKIVRPGALIDRRRFDPPGRLGRRIGNLFVAVGSQREQLGVADVRFAGRTLAWMATSFAEAPDTLNLLDPDLPTRGELVAMLRERNPDLTVVRFPGPLLVVVSAAARLLQRILRPRTQPIDLARIFAAQRYETSLIRGVRSRVEASEASAARSGNHRPVPASLARLSPDSPVASCTVTI